MTESHFNQLAAPVAVPLQALTANGTDDGKARRSLSVDRKRKLSRSESALDLEFLSFLTGTGLLDSGSFDEEQHGFLSSLLMPGGSVDASSLDFMQHAVELSAAPLAQEPSLPAPAESAAQWVAPAPMECDITKAAHAANNCHALQFPAGPSAPSNADDDDTRSTHTVPMPHKRQRQQRAAGHADEDGDEACSSANDLVEMPCSSGDEPPSFKPCTPPRSQTPATPAAAAAQRSPTHATATATSAPPTPTPPSATTNTPTGAAEAAAAPSAGTAPVRAVLVAKVLTKSDATSKRIILPRIAVEANLPQLATADHFYFTATDAAGRAWELVVKAWANGSNPRPVFVIEQVQELMKVHSLGAGDAFGLLADATGAFFVETNTDTVRTAASRPTLSAFTFAQQPAAGGASASGGAGKGATGAGGGRKRSAAAAAEQDGAAGQAPVEGRVTVGGAFMSAQHDHGVLVCPRTAGCTRPPGHQGWCVGHRGFKAMRRHR